MIFFGTARKRIGVAELHRGDCISCGSPSLNLTMYAKYFHLFFIPTFPYKKIVEGKCRNCGRRYEEDDFPSYFDETLQAAKKGSKMQPILFIGLLLMVLGIAYTGYRQRVKAGESRDYLAAPKINDIYVLPIGIKSGFKYVICRIDGIYPDSLLFSLGEDAYAFQGGAEKAIDKGAAAKDEYFQGEITLARKEVAAMLEDEEVKPIVRPAE